MSSKSDLSLLGRRLLKSSLRLAIYQQKIQAQPSLQGVLLLEEELYGDAFGEWSRAVAENPDGIDTAKVLVTELPKAVSSVEHLMGEIQVDAADEIRRYVESFDPARLSKLPCA